ISCLPAHAAFSHRRLPNVHPTLSKNRWSYIFTQPVTPGGLAPGTPPPGRGCAAVWRGDSLTKSPGHAWQGEAANDRQPPALPSPDTRSAYCQPVAHAAGLRAEPHAAYARQHASGTPPALPLPRRSSLRASRWGVQASWSSWRNTGLCPQDVYNAERLALGLRGAKHNP